MNRRCRLLAVALAALLASSPVAAWWTDSAQLASGSVSARTVPAHGTVVCTDEGGVFGLLGYARLTWTHVAADVSYRYEFKKRSDGAVLGSGTINPGVSVGTNVTFDVTTPLLTLTIANAIVDITIASSLTGAPAWTGPTTTTPVHTSSLLVGLSTRCGAS